MKLVISRMSLVVILGALWGAGYTIARFAVTHGVEPLGYAFWQSFGPALLLLIILKVRRVKIPTTPEYIKFFLVCGILGITLPNTIMYFVAQYLPAGILAVVINTSALMIYILAILFKTESFSWLRIIGVLLAFVGVLLVIVPQLTLPHAPLLLWLLLALMAPLCFALCAIFIIKKQPVDSNILVLSCGMLIASSIFLTPLVYVTHSFYTLTLHFSLPEMAILLEILISSLGYFILFRILTTAGAVYYSLVGPFVVLSGVFWGWLVFGERLLTADYIAAAFVVLGLVFVALKRLPKSYATRC